MSRKKTFNTKYSAEFKISVIMDMRENHLSYRETARKYKIGSNESQGKDRLRRWGHISVRGSRRSHDRTSRKEKLW